MNREKKEVIKPPIKWQERVEDILSLDMPDAPYFASWVAGNINWTVPVVNPWDYSKRYSLGNASFHSGWVKVLARLCEEYLKLKKEHPDDKDVWYVHKAIFGDGITEELRNHYKLKHWGLIRLCPKELSDKQIPVQHPHRNEILRGSAGRAQPTDHTFAFLANAIMVPYNVHILRDHLVGMSGHYVNMSRVLSEWSGFDKGTLSEPPSDIKEPRCEVCNEVVIPFYLTHHGELFCHKCAKKGKNRVYNKLVKNIRGKIKTIKKERGDGRSTADRLSAGWGNHYAPFYSMSKHGVSEEVVVVPSIGSKGAIVLTEKSLRGFLNKRERRRRELAELRAKKEKEDEEE